jgi:F-type H+-transporting ATPase subunit delta
VIRDIIAKRYARAFFAFASERGVLDQETEELRRFGALMDESPELFGALTNPVFETSERKGVLDEVVSRLGLSRNARAFLSILVDKNKIRYLHAILDRLDKMVDEAEGRLRVEVVSATELDDAVVTRLREKLAQLTKKDVQLNLTVDESLIGGLVTRFAGMVYDGSVKTQLHNLGENLIKEW